MEQLIILLLLLSLPRIIKALAKQGRAAKPAPGQRPARSEPIEAAGEEEAEIGDLPPWLESLAKRLGDAEQGARPQSSPPAPRSASAPEPRLAAEVAMELPAQAPPSVSRPRREARDATPGAQRQRYLAGQTGGVLRQVQERRATALMVERQGSRPLLDMPRGRRGWRRAIVMAEVIGAPRALRPWQEADSSRPA